MNIVKSKIVPIQRDDIDTDLIIPAEFLTVTTKTGLARNLFERLRAMDLKFPINLEKYQGAQIMIAGKNFGCGSSREHAPWALYDWGIRVVVAPSFADIFYSNALKNQILPIVLPAELVDKIFETEASSDVYEIEVDLSSQKISLPGIGEYDFEIDPYRKECLIKEIDDMNYLLSNIKEIQEFDKKHACEIFFDINKIEYV